MIGDIFWIFVAGAFFLLMIVSLVLAALVMSVMLLPVMASLGLSWGIWKAFEIGWRWTHPKEVQSSKFEVQSDGNTDRNVRAPNELRADCLIRGDTLKIFLGLAIGVSLFVAQGKTEKVLQARTSGGGELRIANCEVRMPEMSEPPHVGCYGGFV